MAKGNKYFVGNSGRVWVNDVQYAEIYKFEAKRANAYEEIPDPEGLGNIQVFTGYSVAGSFAMRKIGNEAIMTALKNDTTGQLTVTIIVKEQNPNTGVTERVKYTDVTFDEFPLSQFENRAITEIELSFKARDYEVLQ